MTKRFIVVDPSFTSHDGDRWQYAVDLAKSARETGYKFILLTHRLAPSIRRAAGFPVSQRRIFDHAFYQHDKVYERHRAFGDSHNHRMANLRRKDRLESIESKIRRARAKGDQIAGDRLASVAQRIREAKTNFESFLTDDYSASARVHPFNRDDFAHALAAELIRINPGPDDILFFHTMTYGMMESLSEVTAAMNHRPPFDTQAYFLFHFGIDAPDSRTFVDRYYSYSAYGSIAARMKVGSPFARLHFLATCESLQQEAAEILGAPVALWHGLVDPRYVEQALGGNDRIKQRREFAQSQLESGEIRVLVRAADLNVDSARAVSRACHLVQHRGNVVRLRLIYHRGSFSKLRDIVTGIDFPNLQLVETERNEAYLKEVCDAGIVLLTYDPDKYAKRVSAVLHDCAVLGVPVLVPFGTTLAECEYATKFVFGSVDGLVGALLNAVRFLQRNGGDFSDLTDRAKVLLAGNAVERLLHCSPEPSISRSIEAAPVANVIMPLWGRVGSSFAMEAQLRYLIDAGYFVNQLFLMEKPVDPLDAIEYFWKILRENSLNARGSIQRVAFRTFERNSLRLSRDYFKLGAFDQLCARYEMNCIEDPQTAAQVRKARLTIVNHVFHGGWAFRHAGGRKILESHDIQSYQMVAWPLLNEATGQPEPLSDLLAQEMAMVRRFDYVVNVAPEEHNILRTANPRAALVTPYLPERKQEGKFKAVWDMAYQLQLHESYREINEFDLLVVGDSHPANRESAVWFVKDVFEPFLAPLNINLALVGRLSDAVHDAVGAVPHLFYLGFVDDLESVRALSRLAVLPDRRGTGISIKSLEAMASGMPFVATSVALRGVRDRLPSNLPAYDEPAEMAEAIKELLLSKEALNSAGRLARECYLNVAGKEQFDAAWGEILNRTLKPSPNIALQNWRALRHTIKKRFGGQSWLR